ncbi:MAG: type II secretion system minor pseudopilin GspI [Pseudomonadales bacterium]
MTSGFTLIELLIAMVVLAIAGIIVSTTVGNVASQTFTMERRLVAHWVAEDYLTRVRLTRHNGSEISEGRDIKRIDNGGRRWELRSEIKATNHPMVKRMELSVYEISPEGKAIGPLDSQSAFLGVHG